MNKSSRPISITVIVWLLFITVLMRPKMVNEPNFDGELSCVLWTLNDTALTSVEDGCWWLRFVWHLSQLFIGFRSHQPDASRDLTSRKLTMYLYHPGCRHRGGSEHNHRNERHRDHTCDSSWALIQSAAALMAARHPDTLEFVLWTG